MSFKQQCIELRKKDHTLNEITKLTGRSKTTVYFHIKNIPLSAKKRKEVSRSYRKRALNLSAARKGKSSKSFKKFTHWTPDLVLLVSHLMFDGEILKSRCRYHNRSEFLINRVECLMKIIYEYECTKNVDNQSGVVSIGFYNVALEAFLKTKSSGLLKTINKLPRAHQREFLRAFFDDEGCMDFRISRNVRRIRGYQNDLLLLELVKNLLSNFGIESSLRGKNEVVITGKENLKKFRREINFSKGVRLNPNRTNSLWKKNIEKRKLLAMAIKSFKT